MNKNEELINRWEKEVAGSLPKYSSGIKISTREFRSNLSDTIMRTAFGKQPHIITHHGKPYAAMVDLDTLAAIKTSHNIITEFSQTNGYDEKDGKKRFLKLVRDHRTKTNSMTP